MFENEANEYKMVAPDVDRLLLYFFRDLSNPIPSTPALLAAIEPLFEVLEPLEPLKKNDEVKTIWIRIPRGTIEDYDSFDDLKERYVVKTYEEYEKQWEEDYPNEYNWYRLVVVQSFNKEGSLRFYGMSLGNRLIISATLEDDSFDRSSYYCECAAVKLCNLILPAVKESMRLLHDGEYNDLVEKDLPYEFRTGVVKRSELWAVDRDYKKLAYDELSEETVSKFIERINSGCNSLCRVKRIKEFTANDFFRACKLGYEAIGKDCDGFSLSELYMHYADGRDEGLTGKGHGLNAGPGINFDDPKAWDEWYFHREQHGGHPWEVVPGGNSTHMELSVMHDRNSLDFDLRLGRITREEYEERIKKAGYYFMIDGIHRAFESVNFYLALSDAGLPVIITDADKLMASFTGSDYIGIVPHRVVTRYCGELFPKEYEDIFDFSHVSKAKDQWFDKIIWLPMEPAVLKRK